MIQNYNKIHNAFKLNGQSFNEKTLKNQAYSLIEEGVEFEKEIGLFLLDWLNGKEIIIVNTSGSTGTPKAIKLSKEAMVNSAMATGSFFNLREGNKALLCLSTKHIAGKMMLVRAMVLGLDIDCIIPSTTIKIENSANYVFAAMVPMQVQNSIESLKAIRTLIVGGASVSLPLISLLKTVKTQVYETYGMTETITHIAVKKLNNFDLECNTTPFFKTLPNITITKDNRNCLVIKAPKLTNEKIITNDVVKLHASNEFEWRGRYDNIINSGGIKINPEHIEQKLKQFIKERFFIASEKDVLLGEKIVLFIETENENINEIISNKLKEIKSIDSYEKPKRIIPILRFIETASGKIKRKESIATLKN